ncbi:MAG: CvpA family protein [Bacteroidetes bacterium]|nr:CvpA family protein [Bacteroidota bacterium]
MATLDIFILIVLGIGLLRGAQTGFLRQMAALLGTILSFVLAASFMGTLGEMIGQSTGLSRDVSSLLGFMTLFVVVKLAVNVVARRAESLLEAANLSGLDRLAGGLTGALKAAVAMSLVFVVIGFAQLPGEVSRDDSELYRPVYRLVPEAWGLLSDRAPAFEELRRKVEDRLDFHRDSLPI